MINSRILNKFRYAIKKIIGLTGYELKNKFNDKNNLYSILKKANIETVIDVGANSGQFGKSLREQGYKNRIISFEPVESAYQQLINNSKNDSKWVVPEKCAIGAQNETLEINISKNSFSSSILPMLDLHKEKAPFSEYISKEKVPVYQLDLITQELIAKDTNFFLKIDTQGYEMEVFRGASKTIDSPYCKGILSELSLVELYSGSSLWLDIINFLEKKGYMFWSIYPGFTDLNNGRLLQADGLFIRKSTF